MSGDSNPTQIVLEPRAVPAAPRAAREVDLEEFSRLLVSRRALERLPHAPRGFRGLRDPATGQSWLVRASALLRAS